MPCVNLTYNMAIYLVAKLEKINKKINSQGYNTVIEKGMKQNEKSNGINKDISKKLAF